MKKKLEASGGLRPGVQKLFLLMRLTIFLILSSVLASTASVYSQSTRLTVKMNNCRISEVFDYIEKQSEFYFFYNRDNFDDTRIVSVNVDGKTIDQILDELFAGQPISYEIVDKSILIKTLADSIEGSDSGQQKSVSGKVTDPSNSPLPGVTIVIRGTTNGTVTNSNGEYLIANVPDDATLTFSFVGMKTQEIVVGSQTSINVTMVADAIGIEEIVAIGYGTQKKINVTGSIASVKSEDITTVPVSNVTQALQGKLSGLIVDQNSGRPGSDGGDIYIRGFGANLGGVQGERPLIIVDGFEREFSQLDPNEIESVTILKDASAAVYGVRAAAGVILVTTKRGDVGKPVITYNGTYSLTENTRYPEFASYLDYQKALAQHALGANRELTGLITPEREAALNSGEIEGTNWFDVVTRDFAPQETHNLNIRGGNKDAKYFASIGYINQGTIWESGDFGYKRYNGTMNLDFNVSKNVKSSVNLGWRREERSSSTAVGENDLFNIGFSNPGFPSSLPDGRIPLANVDNPWSPIAATNKDIAGSAEEQKDVINGSMELSYAIPTIKGLSVKGTAGILRLFDFTKTLRKPYSLWAYDGTNYVNEQITHSGLISLTEYSYRFTRLTTQLSLSYERSFGDHNLGALLLWERVSENNEYVTVNGNDLLSGETPYLSTNNPEAITGYGNATEYGREGLVGRLNYSYKGKYLFEFSFRNDASSYFPEATRVGFFPGVSAGWVLSKESFLENSEVVSFLKLRTSYSRLGNDQANRYDYIEGFEILGDDAGYVFGGKYQNSIRTLGVANPAITWQLSDLYNIGIESSFFDRKLGVELETFYRKRTNLLAIDDGVTIPSTVGASLPLQNLESTDNRGFEAMINYRGGSRDFNFDISANINWAREKYLGQVEPEDYGDPDLERINRLEGNYVNRTFGYVFDGFFVDQDEIDNLSIDYFNGQNGSLKPGDIKLKDLNGDNLIDTRDRTVIGRSNIPEWTYGLNAKFQWKNFDLTMFWQGAANFNQNISDDERGLIILNNGARTPFKYVTDRLWTAENLGEGAEFPVDMTGPTNGLLYIDKYYLDSKYVRLKNLVIGYSLPASIIKKAGFEQVHFYLSGTNLITIDGLGFYPYDPESGGRVSYPTQRVYTLGVNVSF